MPKFYYLSLTLISVFSGISLFSIWQFILRNGPVREKKDFGLAYLSGAMGVWALVGVWGMSAAWLPKAVHELGLSLASTANSLLYLLAVQHFDYSPQQIRRQWWQPTVLTISGLIGITSASLVWYGYANQISVDQIKTMLWWPDVVFSLPTIIMLGVCFWRSFYYRGYIVLAWLSTIVMLIIFFVQLPEVLPWLKQQLSAGEQWLTLSSYALLMMLCFALGTTWGVEIFALPQSDQTFLKLDGKEGRWWMLHLQVKEHRFTAYFAPIALTNFLRFVTKRIENEAEGWLSLDEELNGGFVDFSRILKPIAEAWEELEGTGQNTQKEYIERARRTFFEYRNPGQYRLKIDLQNIEFTNILLVQQDDLINAMRSNKERDEVMKFFEQIEIWQKNKEGGQKT